MLAQKMKSLQQYKNLVIVEHPLIQHKLANMRDKKTSSPQFRQLLKEISMLMGYEITRNFPTELSRVETPLEITQVNVLKSDGIIVIPILRAGLGMADGLMELMPSAPMGHIGLYRDEKTKRPIEYMVKLPPTNNRECLLVDPMLATGYSAAHAVQVVKNAGVNGCRIRVMSLVASPEGVAVMAEQHPDIEIYTAALDRELDSNSYILPGLGDAGDRLYGTK